MTVAVDTPAPEGLQGWFLVSMSDGDTHRGVYFAEAGKVRALCGAVFDPLRLTTCAPIVLKPEPPDPDQVCPVCRGGRVPRQRESRPGHAGRCHTT